MIRSTFDPSRRRLLTALGCGAAGLGMIPLISGRRAHAAPGDGKFLFVIGAQGGASIADSFLPVASSEVSAEAAETRIVYPDEFVSTVGGLRCVRNVSPLVNDLFNTDYDLTTFLQNHGDDTLVMTMAHSSVNHVVAQKRSIDGNGIDGGRTIQEAVAGLAGPDVVLPNCNMARGGFSEQGAADIDPRFRAEVIADPTLFALATHGHAGVIDASNAADIARARAARADLEAASAFGAAHAGSARRNRYIELRDQLVPTLEAQDVISKLMLFEDGVDAPLSELGLSSSPELDTLRGAFPNLVDDNFEAQAALAFLLARYGLSNVVSIGLSLTPEVLPGGKLVDTPLAFDFSHTSHVTAQNTSWGRMMKTVDALIDLLKAQPHGDGSMWDSSVVYVATDFGRDKVRPPGQSIEQAFGTGHHLNNGSVLISPLLKGGRVFGDIDPETGLTFGFDPLTGEADPGREMTEGDVYSLIAEVMGVSFPGQKDLSALIR